MIIRFNAIGDIVLTSPVSQALSDAGYEVHYLVKAAFAELVLPNPNISKVWILKDDLGKVISDLKKEKLDCIIDLHNNLRSKRVKKALGTTTHTLSKERVGSWLMTNVGIGKKQRPHIVDRFLKVISPLGLGVKNPETKFYFSQDNSQLERYEIPSDFVAVAVGAAWKTKELPIEKLNEVLASLKDQRVVLLGGPKDKERAAEISESPNILNLAGELSVSDSARIIKRAKVLLSGDTGMMHIAAAIGTPVVAVFGSTHPILGYTPHTSPNDHIVIQNEALSCRPCTKQGKTTCPKGHFKCMMEIESSWIVSAIEEFK